MREEKFKIINLIRNLINDLDKLNISNVRLKDNILKEIYIILKLTYIGNDTYNKVKKKDMQIEILSRIKYLEYLIERINLREKEFNLYTYKLETIIKHIKAWIKYTDTF